MSIRKNMNTWHEQHLAEVSQLIFDELFKKVHGR